MGVIKQGILGGFQNKVGPVIGSSWKGIATMRSMPVSVANPRTAAQVSNRNKFKLASQMGKALLAGIIKPFWDRFAQGESGYNAWMRANLPNFTPTGLVSAANVVMAKGVIATAPITQFLYNKAADNISITVSNVTTGDSLPTDEVYLVLLAAGSLKIHVVGSIGARSTQGVAKTISVPGTFIDPEVIYYAYTVVRRADGTKVSNTASRMSDN